MKIQLALLIATLASSCSLLTTDDQDPYRTIPRGREVIIESTPVCQLVVADLGSHFYFVAREPRGSSTPGTHWLTDLDYVYWADLDRNGRYDHGEPRGASGRQGEATSYFMSREPNHLEGTPKPHYVEVNYTANGIRHHVGPYRLP